MTARTQLTTASALRTRHTHRVAYGVLADSLGTEASRARLRAAQQARDAAHTAYEELRQLAKTDGSDDDMAPVVEEAALQLRTAAALVQTLLLQGYELLPPVGAFQHMLDKASQLWVVSGQTLTLPPDIVAAIVRAHKEEGLGLHLTGDNSPWFADTNCILQALFGGGVCLSGNYLGTGYVMGPVRGFTEAEACAPAAAASAAADNIRGGFLKAHPIMHGVNFVHTGNTVADISIPHASGMFPVIKTTNTASGPLICTLAVKPACESCGACVVGAAFTQMFDFIYRATAGTARYYGNTAGYLATLLDEASIDAGAGGAPAAHVHDDDDADEDEGASRSTMMGLVNEGAFCGPCAVAETVFVPGLGTNSRLDETAALYEVAPNACADGILFFALYEPPDRGTMRTDAAFNNPLAAGARLDPRKVSNYVVSEEYLQLAGFGRGGVNAPNIAATGAAAVFGSKCPFTTLPIVGLLGLVEMSSGPNRRHVKAVADSWFLGGAQRGNTALLMLTGFLYQKHASLMLARAEAPDDEQALVACRAVDYMVHRLVVGVLCAPDMVTPGTGVQRPLFEAFLRYCADGHTTFDLRQTAILADLVARFGPRPLSVDECLSVKRAVRRAFITQRAAVVCAVAKRTPEAHKLFATLAHGLLPFTSDGLVNAHDEVVELCYWGVDSATGFHIDWTGLSRALGGGIEAVSPELACLVGARFLNDVFRYWYYDDQFPVSRHPFICKPGAVLDRWLKSAAFRNLWDFDSKTPPTKDDARAAIRDAVAKRMPVIKYDESVVPLASCFGTSAMSCGDRRFASPAEARHWLGLLEAGETRDNIRNLRQQLIAHVRHETPTMITGSGACNPNTSGASLHRGVIRAMLRPENASATLENVPSITRSVLQQLVVDRQGTEALWPEFTRPTVAAAVAAYIRYRAARMSEPALRADGTLYITFEEKLRGELEVHDATLAAESITRDGGGGTIVETTV